MVAEIFLGYSHSHSALVETLVTNASSPPGEMRIPYYIESYIEGVEKLEATPTLRDYFKRQLLQDLCLGFSPDLRWDRMPENTRKYLVNRCIGQPCSLSETQVGYLKSALCGSSTMDLEEYIARCDYAAFMAALCYTRSTTSPMKEFIEEDTLVSGGGSIRSTDALISKPPISAKRQFTNIPGQVLGYIYHKVGVMCKFFAVAFVADPEFQRELDCILSGSPKIVASMVTFFLSAIWVYSKSIQNLLLPWFLVSSIPQAIESRYTP